MNLHQQQAVFDLNFGTDRADNLLLLNDNKYIY